MHPLVSAVIVTYNKAGTVAASIESALHQTYPHLEIIVVDDGSTDETASRVKAFGSQVRYLPKKNGGTASARNLGTAQARGEYIAFLDGDDLWLPRKLEIQMEAFRKEPSLVGVQCSAYCVDDQLRLFEERACHPRQDTLLDFLLFHNLPAFASAIVAKREILVELGGFETDLVILSDWNMVCRLSRRGTLRSVPDFLVLYRQYPNNQSRDVSIHLWSGVRSLRRFFQDPTLDRAIRKREQQIWGRFYAMLSGGYIRNHQWNKGLRWALKAIQTSPRVIPYVAGMPLRRLFKSWTRPRNLSLAQAFSGILESSSAFQNSRNCSLHAAD